MKAFVQIHTDGEFYNENAYLAWRAFRHFGYDVIKFKTADLYKQEITKETPCYAGVETTKSIFNKLGVKHKELSSYPSELKNYFIRDIKIETVEYVRKTVCSGKKIFAKPLDIHRKLFDGTLFETENDLIRLGGLDDNWPVYTCHPVRFASEYRCFVYNKQILDVRKYKGDFIFTPSQTFLFNVIRSYENAPIAYCIDAGIIAEFSAYTSIVEITDAWSFGHYGLNMVHFGRMLIDRWSEIVSAAS